MDHDASVECLQSPSARLRDGPRPAVRPEAEHLGADQLDLLAGPVELRANPQVALRRHGSQQVDAHPAQPGVVTLSAALQRANEKRRDRRGVLNRRGPRAADQVGRRELFAKRPNLIEALSPPLSISS
jgi:hypothetical protein